MNEFSQTIIIDLGGSIIVPDNLKINFLKRLRKFILKSLKGKNRFVIVTGGGAVARKYIQAASKISKPSDFEKDRLGIEATRTNACLLDIVLGKKARWISWNEDFEKAIHSHYPVLIFSGWKPGFSTDYCAVYLADRFGIDKIIVASKISYLYDKDVEKYKNAKPIKEIKWKDYLKLIDSKWSPGMKAPVDPVASRLASRRKIEAIIVKGNNLVNLGRVIKGEKFQGTVINV